MDCYLIILLLFNQNDSLSETMQLTMPAQKGQTKCVVPSTANKSFESIILGNSAREYSMEFMTKLWDPDLGLTARTSVLLLPTVHTN